MKTFLPSRRMWIAALCLWLLCAGTLSAQRKKREPLTEVQIEEIREASVVPAERIKLYAKFTTERVERIKALTKRPPSAARSIKLNDELLDLTQLIDELADNLDQYSDRRADLRKALKPLTDESAGWLATLRALAGDTGFELARKESIESCDDLSEQAKRLFSEQTEYFNQHKDEAGQERFEPK